MNETFLLIMNGQLIKDALEKYGNHTLSKQRLDWIECEIIKDLTQQPKLLTLVASVDEYVKGMYQYYEVGSLKQREALLK